MCKVRQNLKAIIYDKRGRILSIGQNSYTKTHTLQFKHAVKVGKPYKTVLHAEIDAIIRCRNLDKAHTIKVFRYNRQGKYMLAKPCVVCISAIKEAGIPNIEWTVTEV